MDDDEPDDLWGGSKVPLLLSAESSDDEQEKGGFLARMRTSGYGSGHHPSLTNSFPSLPERGRGGCPLVEGEKQEDEEEGGEATEDDQLEWEGFVTRGEHGRAAVYWLLVVATLGVLWMVTFWLPHWRLRIRGRRCPLEAADTVLVRRAGYSMSATECLMQSSATGVSRDLAVCPVRSVPINALVLQDIIPQISDLITRNPQPQSVKHSGFLTPTSTARLLEFQFRRFVHSNRKGGFVAMRSKRVFLEGGAGRLQREGTALSLEQTQALESIFGANLLTLPIPSVGSLLLREVLHPFYLFQLFAIAVWIMEDYWGYAVAISVAVLLSSGSTVQQVRSNAFRLQKMARFTTAVRCLKHSPLHASSFQQHLSSDALVPGDLLLLDDGLVLPCDLQIISSSSSDASILVDEALLTGESIPVSKLPASRAPSLEDSLLYAGTTVLQARPRGAVQARVLSTGFATAKGALVRSVVTGPTSEGHTEFTRQGFLILACLFVMALLGVAVNSYFVTLYVWDQPPVEQVWLIIDIVTIAVPPALPVALSIGMTLALVRLRKLKIFCTSPPAINAAGQIQLVCFDKTGTLTVDELQLHSVLLRHDNSAPLQAILRELVPAEVTATGTLPMFLTMVACHSLAKLEDTGAIVGDPLDIRMYEAVAGAVSFISSGGLPSFSTTATDQLPCHIQVLHRFAFSSALQRMSCLVRVNGDQHYVLMKGSPEMLLSEYCHPQHLPQLAGFSHTTSEGYRVIACAWRHLPDPSHLLSCLHTPDARPLAEVQHVFELVGGIVFENPIKEDSPLTIAQLNRVRIRSLMITGDHPYTALHVAKQVQIISTPAANIPSSSSSSSSSSSFMSTLSSTLASSSAFSSASSSSLSYEVIGGNLPLHHRGYLLDGNSMMWHPTVAEDGPVMGMAEMVSQLLLDESIVPVITGAGFIKIMSDQFEAYDRMMLLRHCNVWARMKPDQKQGLVAQFQAFGIKTAMVGDGSNDCSALRQADVGVSLSNQAEATMAAPFTSSRTDPSAVLLVLRQGRGALVTSFSVFRYVVVYSMIQYTTTVLCYVFGGKLGNWHYLVQDLLAVVPFALTMANTDASPVLSLRQPPSQILSFAPVFSMMTQILLQACFQLICLFFLLSRAFYSTVPDYGHVNVMSYEVAALYHISMFELIFSGLAVSIGRPFRKEFWTNWLFVLTLCVAVGFELALLFGPTAFTQDLELRQMPLWFNCFLLGMGCIYGILAISVEYLLSRGSIPAPLSSLILIKNNQ